MAEELIGNCLVAQSGGPTALLTKCGWGRLRSTESSLYRRGLWRNEWVLGILKEEIMDLAEGPAKHSWIAIPLLLLLVLAL